MVSERGNSDWRRVRHAAWQLGTYMHSTGWMEVSRDGRPNLGGLGAMCDEIEQKGSGRGWRENIRADRTMGWS